MSDQTVFREYTKEEDKCQNCGAVKIFSALVCPVCGMAYADSQSLKKDKVSRLEQFLKNNAVPKEEEEKEKKEPFDPNASFKEFKKSIDGEDAKEEERPVIMEETGSEEADTENNSLSPDETQLNSGLYGERKYRFSAEPEKPFVMSEKRPEPEPDQTIVPTRYGLDTAAVREKREQSMLNTSGKDKMFSSTVNNHYEQYRSGMDSSYSEPTYSTPYNRGTFDVQPKDKPDTLKKILPLAIILILVLIAGYFLYQYFGL